MKSLRYVLGGRPHTLADCLDLAVTRRPERVTLDLTMDEFVGDLLVVHQLVGSYRWEFSGREIGCKEMYGCVSLPATEREQKSCLAGADAKLQRRLEELRRRGIDVDGAERTFRGLAQI